MTLSLHQEIARIGVALLAGIVIGLERKHSNKSAGVKTHTVISIVCTMLTMISVYGFSQFPNTDPTRLLSNILTGVGFLAGGVIYVTSNKRDEDDEPGETVVGLTTAAGVFGTAVLGIPIGLGEFQLVIITILAIEISLNMEKTLKMIIKVFKHRKYILRGGSYKRTQREITKEDEIL